MQKKQDIELYKCIEIFSYKRRHYEIKISFAINFVSAIIKVIKIRRITQ